MSKKRYNREKHPAEESLSIFPIIPQTKANLVASSTFQPVNNGRRGKNKQQNDRKHCQRVRINFGYSPTLNSNAIKNGSSHEERNRLHITNNKLENASKHLPSIERHLTDHSLSLKLPHIPLSLPCSINPLLSPYKDANKIKDRIPPLHKDTWKPCTCGKKDNNTISYHPEHFADVKLKEIARTFRAEETPRMFSIYVRWKSRRDGTNEYDYHTLVETFQMFGQLSNIVFKSRNSAIIVFTKAESACTAAKVFQQVGREMKMYVRWLNDF